VSPVDSLRDLQPLASLEPLALLEPEDVQRALKFGCMYPPDASARDGCAALQFREGVTFDDALFTALNSIRGAHGFAQHMESEGADEMTRQAASGLVALLQVAGGAVALMQVALYRLEARAAVRGAA
jgi:hypothetical protein